MSKNLFEQPIKREKPPIKEMKEKLDKAEKMVEGVKERWKEKIEGYERIPEKLSEEIEEVFEDEEKKEELKTWWKLAKQKYFFIQKEILPKIPKIPPSLLEKTLQKVIERYERKKYDPADFSLLLTALINRTVQEYTKAQEKKGKKIEDIPPLEIHLDVRKLPEKLEYFGYKNQEKSHLIIEGNVYWDVGAKMTGGRIEVKGNTGPGSGCEMAGGHLIIEGEAGPDIGENMSGGVLEIKGRIEENFAKSAFYPENEGTIIWRDIKIWEKGEFTKEGEKMRRERGIPVW